MLPASKDNLFVLTGSLHPPFPPPDQHGYCGQIASLCKTRSADGHVVQADRFDPRGEHKNNHQSETVANEGNGNESLAYDLSKKCQYDSWILGFVILTRV